MGKSIECEYRRSVIEASEAIKRKGVSPSVRGCARPGECNIDRVCDFLWITNSLECPQILLANGVINEDEFIKRLMGGQPLKLHTE